MLPEGWRLRRIDEVGLVQAGRQVGPGYTSGTKRPYLRVANVFDGYIDISDVKSMYFTDQEFDRYRLLPSDILLNEGQSAELVGRPAMFQGEVEDCCFQNSLIRFRASNDVDAQFALNRFQLCLYDGTFQDISKRTTSIAHLGVSRFAELRLPWPPISEQRVIAATLKIWDKAIDAAQGIVDNSLRQRQALLSRLLGSPVADRAQSGRRGGQSPSIQPGIPSLPPTPEGWTRTSLDKHLIEIRRPAPLEAAQTYRLVTVKRSRGGVELREELTGQDIKTPTQFYVRAGDFLISKRQIVHGACGLVPAGLDGAIVSNEYAVLNSDGKVDLRFLRYLSETRYFQQTCFHSSIGVHVEKMIFKTDRWLKWPFNIPPLAEQQRIVEVLDAAWQEMALIEQQVEKLKQEKAALMADLLTGRRRVRVAEAEATT